MLRNGADEEGGWARRARRTAVPDDTIPARPPRIPAAPGLAGDAMNHPPADEPVPDAPEGFPDAGRGPDGADRPERPLEIRVEGVAKSFGGNHVLHGIDLEVRQGELVTIVGPSGCGKSVLIEIVTARLAPDEGRVLVADHERDGDPLIDVHGAGEAVLDELRRHWAIVFQHNALFSGSVRENIALWLREVAGLPREAVEERVRDAIERVGMNPEQVLGEDRDELSGGMSKRVAIARAIAMDPRLMFYDEPTTGLDPIAVEHINELIVELNDRYAVTSVVVTHDMPSAFRVSDRIAMIDRGYVIFQGTSEDIRHSDDRRVRDFIEGNAPETDDTETLLRYGG